MTSSIDYVTLDYRDIAIAALLLLLNAGLSLVFRLGIARQQLIAGARMMVQLTLVGMVLTWLFAQSTPLWTLLIVMVMVGFAGWEILGRQKRRFAGFWAYGLGGGTMLFVGMLVTLLALTTQIRPDPWYDPRYLVPLLGMILGNAMTGIALALNNLTSTMVRERPAIEARLTLGATWSEASGWILRDTLRTGLMPMINAMNATGLVFLPGMMTGQILAGVAPVEAVKYQILIMFLIGGATGLGVVLSSLIATRRLSDPRHRLRLDRLRDT